MPEIIRIVDLFAGIGGLRQGALDGLKAKNLAGEVVFTSEIKKTAIKVLQANHPSETINGDVTKVDETAVPDHDLLLAGFPCQAFSYAGLRKGFEDETKGTLFFDVVRILKEKKTPRFILENVEGLLTHDPDPSNPKAEYGRTFSTILATLEDLGYKVDWRLLEATNHGVPQIRKRVFIIGSLESTPDFKKLHEMKSAPLSSILETGVTETDPKVGAFADLLKESYSDLTQLEGKIFRDWRGGDRNIHSWNINFKGVTTLEERELMESIVTESKKRSWIPAGTKLVGEGTPLTLNQISTFTNYGKDLQPMLDNLTSLGYLRKQTDGYKLSSGKLSMPLSHILRKEGYANTLVATDADRLAVLDGTEIRRLTNTEVRRLFGFPESFILPEGTPRRVVFDLFGNSVVAPVAADVTKVLYHS